MNDNKPKSVYVNKRDGEAYELVTVTALDADNVPMVLYRLKNESHAWEGDQKAFENEFEKV